MLLSRKIDDKEIQLKNQSQAFFQISGAGHEAVLVAAGTHLRGGHDWFFPYYRDRALCLAIGVTPYEMLLASVGAKDDPASGGRQMPSHWGHKRLNIPSQSSATGTQALHAIGACEAGLIYQRVADIAERESKFHPDEVTYLSIGDGATSEGEFWESLNTACTRKLPILYLVEDNGYAISVPVEVQTPGGDISRIVEHFPGMRVWRCDGTDYLASHRTLGEAVAHVRARKGPAFVHASVIRPYSHSLSDDEKLYKTPLEREAEARRDPLTRMRHMLKTRDCDRRGPRRHPRVGRARGERGRRQALRRRSPNPRPRAVRLFAGRRSLVRAVRDRAAAPGHADTMVAAINTHAARRDGARPAHRDLRRGRRGREPRGDRSHGRRQGRRLQGHARLQRAYGSDRVFNSPLAEANIIGRASAWRCAG
jgi:2-oxoisovalerate dehydrogenase E1 component